MTNHSPITTSLDPTEHRHAGGPGGRFSLPEPLVTDGIRGNLTTNLPFRVVGASVDTAASSCDADQRNLGAAAESDVSQSGTDEVPATATATGTGTGTDDDRGERAIADDGFLRTPSELLALEATATTPAGSLSC